MPLHPSKKIKTPKREINEKIEEILMEAFTNPHSENKPPSLVMENFRTKAVAQGYSTPNLKKSKGNVVKVLISTPPNKRRIGASCDLSSIKRKYGNSILVLRTQIESKILKIQEITDKCIMMCEKRLLVDHEKSKILESMKNHEEIIKIIRKNAEGIKEIEEMIKAMNDKRDEIRLEVIELEGRIRMVLFEKNLREKELKELIDRNTNIGIELEVQEIKNKSLHERIRVFIRELRIDEKIPIFSKDLFDTFVLQAQITNSITLNKMKSPLKVVKKHKNEVCESNFSLCFLKNNGVFKGLPSILVIICRLYVQMKLRNINKVLLNKISYFCPEAARLFDLDTFKNMVKEFYVHIFPISFEGETKFSEDENDKRSKKISKEQLDDEEGEKILANLFLSSTCECGKEFFDEANLNLLMYLLKKYFGISLKNVEYHESCSMLYFFDEKMQFERSNDKFLEVNSISFKDSFFESNTKQEESNFLSTIKR